jgi:hypothetical protein
VRAKPGVRDVVLSVSEFARVSDLELDIREPSSELILACECHDRGVEVDADRSPRRPNDPREFQGHVPAPAPDVDACLPFTYAGLGEQRERRRSHDLGEQVQAPLPVGSACDRVLIRRPGVGSDGGWGSCVD